MSNDQGIKNVVLVHGAFADGSGWRRVYDNLTGRGYRVIKVRRHGSPRTDPITAI